MDYLSETLNNLEQLKEDLILLNDIYDDVFKPWIIVEVKYDEVLSKDNDSVNQSTDLNLLHKLENILIKASNIKEKTIKSLGANAAQQTLSNITVKTMKNKMKTVNLIANNSNAKSDKLRIEKKSQISENPKMKTKFVPAHKTAPFKTDPSLHQRKPRIESKKRVMSAQPIKTNSSIIFHKDVCQNQDINPKPENPPNLVLNKIKTTKNVEHILSQLRNDIERLQEVPHQEETIKNPIFEKKTIFEVKDKMIVPVELKRDCRNYSKLASKLASVYLHRNRPESENNPKNLTRMLLESKKNAMQDIAWEIHTIISAREVLENIVDVAERFDLPTCNVTQIGFMQGCLSWILNEYLNIKSNSSEFELSQQRSPKHSESNEIRQWLDSKSKVTKPTDEKLKSVIQAASLTSCSFVKLLETKINQPISLTIPHSFLPRLKFTIDDRQLLENNSEIEWFTRLLITKQEFQLSLTLLMGKWIRQFKETQKKGGSLSSSFRQIYGLCLDKYPVILKENP